MVDEQDKKQDVFYHGVFNLTETPAEIHDNKVEEKRDMASQFVEERIVWKDKILSMANKFKDMGKMTELQVELYSQRQIVLEQSHYLQSILAKIMKSYKKNFGARTHDYMTGDRKLKMGETSILVEASVSEIKEQIDLIESQIEYMNETKKNIDNMVFGLGHRIQLEEYRRTT